MTQRQYCLAFVIGLTLLILFGCSPQEQADLQTQVSAASTQISIAATALPTLETQAAQAGATAVALATQAAEVRATAVMIATQVGNDPGRRLQEWLGLEAPADTGKLDPAAATLAVASTVETAFISAYKEAGGGKAIGWPVGKVELSDGLLIQYFEGGEHSRSALLMRETETTAYRVPGRWLDVYAALGGPGKAGYPTTNPESFGKGWWQFWSSAGIGDRQIFSVDGETYALLKASGSESVYAIAPEFWKAYEQDNLVETLGFPLSHYPLDDSAWQDAVDLSTAAREMMEVWQAQPFRTMIFQNGAVFYTADWQAYEVIEKEKISGGLGQANLLLGAARGFKFTHEAWLLSGSVDECTLATVRHARIVAGGEAANILGTEVAFLPLKATLAGISLGAESVSAKVALTASQYLLKLASGTEVDQATVSSLAGWLAEAAFSKAVGDFLLEPVAQTAVAETVDQWVDREYAALKADRLSRQLSLKRPAQPGLLQITLNTQLAINYDPLTRIASGVIITDCMANGLAFQYRVDPLTGYPVDTAGVVWPAGVRYWDLATGQPLP